MRWYILFARCGYCLKTVNLTMVISGWPSETLTRLTTLCYMMLFEWAVHRLEHLAQVSAANAKAVLVLHPEVDVLQAPALTRSVSSSLSGLSGATDLATAAAAAAAADRDGPAVLKLQTVMALATELMGRKSAVVVQVRWKHKTWGCRQICICSTRFAFVIVPM
jgi:hypothetical protein